jgi:hypothetical protein
MSDVQSGNFASGQTDKVIAATLIAAGPRALLTGSPSQQYKTTKPVQCPQPFISPYVGGVRSSVLLQNQINAAVICNQASNLAAAKLRQIPGCPVDTATRFAQYQRYQPPAPCPVSTINPAIPAAINGPCTNVIGIVQTWPPH